MVDLALVWAKTVFKDPQQVPVLSNLVCFFFKENRRHASIVTKTLPNLEVSGKKINCPLPLLSKFVQLASNS